MNTIVSSPSSPCPLSPPRSPLSLPTRKPKARSISSFPPTSTLRLTPSTSMPPTTRAPPHTSTTGVLSPSRLPATESMSYFPPFETMGSSSVPDEEMPEAGPSRSPDTTATHAKGRSLGSLAGLMSFLSPGLSPHRPVQADDVAPLCCRSNSDGDVLEALTRRVTPGKRRVLEPMTRMKDEDFQGEKELRHRRRRTSGDLGRRKTPEDTEYDECVVESLVTPSKPKRRPRPLLNLPLPALPSWRFPIPSPPVISLSPDIPLSAFSPIDNPASNPSSTESSPSRLLTPSSLCFNYTPRDDSMMDDTDSPTVSHFGTLSSGPSRPVTPDQEMEDDVVQTSPESVRSSYDPNRLYPKLERTVSQISCDSKETIRPSKEMQGCFLDGEITPKAGKAVKSVF